MTQERESYKYFPTFFPLFNNLRLLSMEKAKYNVLQKRKNLTCMHTALHVRLSYKDASFHQARQTVTMVAIGSGSQ